MLSSLVKANKGDEKMIQERKPQKESSSAYRNKTKLGQISWNGKLCHYFSNSPAPILINKVACIQ